MGLQSVGSPGLWIGFLVFVFVMLALDLGVFHRRTHAIGLKEAAGWSALWISLALAFNVLVYFLFGGQKALEFTTGYLIEKALSVDNLFVFVVLFRFFGIPGEHQHRVLFWGILGALITRACFIVAGGAFLATFKWAIYVFGGILVVTGAKLFGESGGEVHPEQNPVLRLFRRFFPVTPTLEGPHFWIRRNGRGYATPLLLALITIEATDIVFAVDSIPAVFAVTLDPFIVFTSNIFAILGLRALYFLLAGVIEMFRFLKYGLAIILIFVGAKMLVSGFFHIPIGASLGVIAAVLTISILASLLLPAKGAHDVPRADAQRGK